MFITSPSSRIDRLIGALDIGDWRAAGQLDPDGQWRSLAPEAKRGAPGEIRTPDPLVRSQRYRYCTVDSKGLYRVGRGTKGTEITLIGALLVLTFYPRHHNPSVEKAKKRPTEGGLSRWLIVSLHTCEFRLRRPSCIDPFLVSVDRTLHSLRDRLRVDSRGGVR